MALTALLILLTAGIAAAQSSTRVDRILARVSIDNRSAAYLAVASANLIDPDDSGTVALEVLGDLGFNVESLDPDEPARLADFAYMLMLAHDLPGGIMYSLFPGPRYAYRDMRHERLIRGSGDPGEPFSGRRAMRIVGRVLSFVEDVDA